MKISLEEWKNEQEFRTLSEESIIEEKQHVKRGRPSTDATYTSQFYITGRLSTSLRLKAKAQDSKGLFIIATNDCSENFSMQFILGEYKLQQAVERGFRFLKSPDFLTSSLFLKKPERIEVLLMIMTTCLMVYASIEHQIRKALVDNKATFPDMKKSQPRNQLQNGYYFVSRGSPC